MYSPEIQLYIGKELTTRQVRTTASELLKWNMDITQSHADRVSNILKILGKRTPEHPIQRLLDPANVKASTQAKWDIREMQTAGLLVQAGVIKDLSSIDGKISDFSLPLANPNNPTDIFQFLRVLFARCEYLLSKGCQQKMDCLSFAGWSFVGSRLLRKAMFDEIYLLPPAMQDETRHL